MTLQKLQKKNWALCLDAGEYEGVSLFAMKLYEYVPDSVSEKQGFLRVIDEDEEPYYYDAKTFLKINALRKGLLIPFGRVDKPRRKHTRTKANGH